MEQQDLIGERDAQAARLQESLMLGTDDESVYNTESDRDEDEERPALESAFHNMRIARIATFRHFRLCPCCAEGDLSEFVDEHEEKYDGWVFFTIADTEAAIKTGWLTLRFGSNSIEYDIGRRVCDGLWNMGFTLTWDGNDETPVDVLLNEADLALMIRLETADKLQKAKKHHKTRMLRAFRLGVFKQKVARRVIGNALIEWAARPGGASTRVAGKQWQKKSGQSVAPTCE